MIFSLFDISFLQCSVRNWFVCVRVREFGCIMFLFFSLMVSIWWALARFLLPIVAGNNWTVNLSKICHTHTPIRVQHIPRLFARVYGDRTHLADERIFESRRISYDVQQNASHTNYFTLELFVFVPLHGFFPWSGFRDEPVFVCREFTLNNVRWRRAKKSKTL